MIRSRHAELCALLAFCSLAVCRIGRADAVPLRTAWDPNILQSAHSYVVKTLAAGGKSVDKVVVPGRPPANFRAVAVMSPMPNASSGVNVLPNVPAFDWCYGCSATSAAMMMGYYDNTGYPNMYAGPTNGGVCPLTNSVWGVGQCPLSATNWGIDGRLPMGHVSDYWRAYGDCDQDPWIGNWREHVKGDCTADYMGTNQSRMDNCDGSTTFFFASDGTPLNDYSVYEPYGRDGCHGMRLFVESRGYGVSANFSQYIAGYVSAADGFSFQDFRSEINAGRPVMIQVAGHSMVGFGYDASTSTIYIHDTWDHNDHQMTWGGSYSGLEHYGVTVLRPTGGMVTGDVSFSPGTGTYDSPQNVTITCATPGAVMHYTLTGDDPTGSDPIVTGPVLVDKNLTLKARAWKQGQFPGSTGSAAYAFEVVGVSFSPEAGAYNSPQNVKITTPTAGAVIRYTTNGLDPTVKDPVAGGPLPVKQAVTFKARAWKAGLATTPVKSSSYTIVPLSGSKRQPNNSSMSIAQAVVTAVPTTGLFYVEADDRSCGIMVAKGAHGLTPGKRVSVQGSAQTTAWGEKYLVATSVTETGTGTIKPLALVSRDLGGADWCYNSSTKAGQKGVRDYVSGHPAPSTYSSALNNVGLLITTTGRVTYSTTGYFYVDDGYGLTDNPGHIGIKVQGSVPPPQPLPPSWTAVGHYVKVTGISSCFKAASPGTDVYRQIWCAQVTLVR